MSAPRYLGCPAVVPGRHRHTQAELAAALRGRLTELDGADSIRKMVGFIYEHSAIEHRHLEVELAQIAERSDWYLLVNDATFSLARRALAALAKAGTALAELDGLIVVSSAFAGFPALSRRLQVEFGLDLELRCYDLAGLGCAGPTHGLELADMLVATGACKNVAVVCADAMGTHGESRIHHQIPSMSQLVAHCLASDGSAALTVSAAPPKHGSSLAYTDCRLSSRLWPESLAENDFTTSTDNQPLIAVGKAIRTRLLDELGPMIADIDPDTSFFHPGGAALMRILGTARPELSATLELSSTVLRERGNIGAASILFVLNAAWTQHEWTRSDARIGPTLRMIALGPGIVSTQLLLTGVDLPTRAHCDARA